jgi:hypothetical protein
MQTLKIRFPWQEEIVYICIELWERGVLLNLESISDCDGGRREEGSIGEMESL